MGKNCTACIHASGYNDGIDTYCEIHKTGVFLTETCEDFMENPPMPVVDPLDLREWTATKLGTEVADILLDSDYEFILKIFDERGEILFFENEELYSINLYIDKKEKPVRSIIDLIAQASEWCVDTYKMVNESGFVGTQDEYDTIKARSEFAQKRLSGEIIDTIINDIVLGNKEAHQMAS